VSVDNLGIGVVFAIAALFLIWYLVGAMVNRRRIAAAARWVHRGLESYRDPHRGTSKASIKWLSTNAFSILVEDARAPVGGVSATVLLQSRDMITVWLADLLSGRRDLLLLRYDFRRQPIWGVEIFRRRSILAGDARRYAAQEGWSIEPSADAELLTAHGGGKAGELCHELLEALGGDRRHVIRLAVRRQAPHLTLAFDLPDPATADPAETIRLADRLARVVLGYSTR
jgi:hypothetical protein